MEWSRYTTALAADAARLAEAADGRMDEKVPTCPDWTVADLVHHVARGYEYATACIVDGAAPETEPPERTAAGPLTRLRTALGALLAEFTARRAADPAFTWHESEQTVGFWARRMALETAVHRADAELAAGVEVAPVPEDVAAEGVAEILRVFPARACATAPEDYADALAAADGAAVTVAAGERVLTVRVTAENVEVADGGPAEGEEADARVVGPASDVLLWLWRRGPAEAVDLDGDEEAARRLQEMLAAFTR